MEIEGSTATLEQAGDLEKNPAGVVKRWLLELKLADKRESDWRKKGERVWKRYRQHEAKRHSFNILWANTETLRPAVYNSLPSPDVRRRFKDADPLGKAASEVLSRALEYGLDTTDFDHNIKAAVLDMLLPGRGVCRVKYVPSISQVSNEESDEGYDERLDWEQSPIEHVQWDDFRISSGKEWCEVCWIAFRHRLTRDELIEQFGEEIGRAINLDSTEDDVLKSERDEVIKDSFKTAEVWEIWDKDKKEVIFISNGYKNSPLKVVADPLNLVEFYPIPRPLYSIEDSASLVPLALFELYKEQADELDAVSKRINTLIKGLKMRGIYDATLVELSELMRGEDNDLIPAQNVTALLERGGLEKAIWFMPIEQAAKVLKELYIQREQCKGVIYEIIGLGDILRGVSDPNETARAQEIKDKWGGSRISKMASEVSRFIRDLIRIQGEIIAEKFQPETLSTMTGLKFPSMEEKQQALMAQQQGQEVPPEVLKTPTWEEVIQLLRDDKQRTFKVDIETDSTIAASVGEDMAGLREVLQGVVEVINGFGPAVQSGAVPVEVVKELIMTVCRRAKLGNAVEDALDKIQQPQQAPQEQEQDNSLQVTQMQEETKTQIAQIKEDSANQREFMKQQMENMREERRLEREDMKMQLEAAIKIIVANISAKAGVDQATLANANREANEDIT